MLKWSYNARSSYVSVIFPWPEFSLFPNLFYDPYLQLLNVTFLVSLYIAIATTLCAVRPKVYYSYKYTLHIYCYLLYTPAVIVELSFSLFFVYRLPWL